MTFVRALYEDRISGRQGLEARGQEQSELSALRGPELLCMYISPEGYPLGMTLETALRIININLLFYLR